MLHHRATTSLTHQFAEGILGRVYGDHDLIIWSMQENKLRHADATKFRCSLTLFLDEERYGQSYIFESATHYYDSMRGPMRRAFEAGVVVPRAIGEFIHARQEYIFHALIVLIEDILCRSPMRSMATRPERDLEAVTSGLRELAIAPPGAKILFKEIFTMMHDQQSSLENHLMLCMTEPTYLALMVNLRFSSRPELLPDEKGRRLPATGDKHISASFFEVIHEAVAAPVGWTYLSLLLEQLQKEPSHELARMNVILQEISSVCYFEYARVQTLFRRQVQIGCGDKVYRRLSGLFVDGIAKASMKAKPETFAKEKPRLYHTLKLCQPETTPANAIQWIERLDNLAEPLTGGQEEWNDAEFDAFSDLSAVAHLIKGLTSSLSLPAPKLKKGQQQIYTQKARDLAAEIDKLKVELDLTEFVVPIDNLLEPDMAASALKKLDAFIVAKTGASIATLSQDLIDSCFADVLTWCELAKADKQAQEEATAAARARLEITAQERIESRRQKEKTRPAHASAYSVAMREAAERSQPKVALSPIKVKRSSLDVLTTLFSKGYAARSISWFGFTAAMVNAGFSVLPMTGSVYTFQPTTDDVHKRSITLHRPPDSEIERYKLLFYERRLRTAYGWSEKTFELA